MAFSMLQSHAHYSLIIKDHVIRYVELRKPSPNGVRQFAEKPLPEGIIENGVIMQRGKLELILKSCVKDWKLRGKKLFIVVPNAVAVVRKIDLPAQLEVNEVRSYLFMEIGQSIHLPFENPVFDTYLIDKKSEHQELLLFAAPEELVNRYVDLLEDCGTRPIAAEISALSLYRLYQQLNYVEEESTLFIQFDQDGINVSVFKGELLLFIRQVQNEDRQEEIPSSSPIYTDIFAEIERIMSFYQFSLNNGTVAVQKIVLTGDHPAIQDFYLNMDNVLSTPIYPLFNEHIQGLGDQEIPREFQVNIGLALKEVSAK